MADDVLKQFMVSLGYREDEASKRRFMEGLKKAELAVAGLATGLTAMATAATVAALKVAGAFEGLSYASQKAGATIKNLKGLSYAVSQLGGTYEGALASVEAFAKQMRTNPGYEGLVRSLGVATRQNGKLRETTEILTDLGTVFRKQPYYQGYHYAQTLGIDEDTFRAIRDHGDALKRFKDEYERTARRVGLDSEDAARKSTALMQSFRSLQSSAEIVAQKLLTNFVPALTAIIDKLRAWIEANPDQIRVWIENASTAAMSLAAGFMKVVDAITPLVAGLGNITSSITGEKGLQGGLEAFAIWLTTVWLVKILAAFTGVSTGWAAMLLRLGLNPATLLAVGAALSGYAVAKQLPGAVARGEADPATGGATDANPLGDIGKEKQGKLGRKVGQWWKRTMPTWLGGDPAGAASSPTAANPDASKALGDAIAGTESGRAGYNAVLGNGKYGTPDKPISEMTLAEAREFGRKVRAAHGSSSALGRYQIVNTTRDAAQRALGLPDDTVYNAETQERMMRWVARTQGPNAWEGLKGSPRAMVAAIAAINAGGTADAEVQRQAAGQATNVSDAQVIANDHGHYARLSKALGSMDFSARHGAADAPLGVTNNDNSSSRSLNMPLTVTQHISGGGSAADTADATTRALTRFQEYSLRNAQGAIR